MKKQQNVIQMALGIIFFSIAMMFMLSFLTTGMDRSTNFISKNLEDAQKELENAQKEYDAKNNDLSTQKEVIIETTEKPIVEKNIESVIKEKDIHPFPEQQEIDALNAKIEELQKTIIEMQEEMNKESIAPSTMDSRKVLEESTLKVLETTENIALDEKRSEVKYTFSQIVTWVGIIILIICAIGITIHSILYAQYRKFAKEIALFIREFEYFSNKKQEFIDSIFRLNILDDFQHTLSEMVETTKKWEEQVHKIKNITYNNYLRVNKKEIRNIMASMSKVMRYKIEYMEDLILKNKYACF